MNRLVISNQRGGVAKTTTTITLARAFADRGQKVLIIDTDPQGSVASVLKLKHDRGLFDFLVQGVKFEECIVEVSDKLHVMCSNRDTTRAEGILNGSIGRERAFITMFGPVEQAHDYDMILIDVSPSITLLQTCAFIYAETVLIPVAMDTLSFQGAGAALQSCSSLNTLLQSRIRAIGLLPVIVNRRLGITDTVLRSLDSLSHEYNIPLLSPVRTDQSVTKAARVGKFLADFDPKCKALEDYEQVAETLATLLKETNGIAAA